MIVKLHKKNRSEIIKSAKDVLKNSGIVMYASDTSYGLAVNYADRKAVEKLNKLKDRKKTFYSLNFSNFDQIKAFYNLNSQQAEIIEKYLPGEFTFILEPGKPACRMPKESIITEIVESLDAPVTATSANRSGEKPAFKIDDLNEEFLRKITLIIDEGELPCVPPSTIVDLTSAEPKVLRQGRANF